MVHRTLAERAAAQRAAALDGVVVGSSGGIHDRANRYRSTDEEETSPIDNVIVNMCAPAVAAGMEAGMTPNHLSIVGALLAFASLVALWFRYDAAFVLLMTGSYFMDVMDGWAARTWHAYDPYGEALDHYKDIVVIILLAIVIIFRVRPPPVVLVLIAILYVIALVGESCMQRAIHERRAASGMGGGDENSLDCLTSLCPPGADPTVARWVSTPSFLVLVGGAMLAVAAARFVKG